VLQEFLASAIGGIFIKVACFAPLGGNPASDLHAAEHALFNAGAVGKLNQAISVGSADEVALADEATLDLNTREKGLGTLHLLVGVEQSSQSQKVPDVNASPIQSALVEIRYEISHQAGADDWTPEVSLKGEIKACFRHHSTQICEENVVARNRLVANWEEVNHVKHEVSEPFWLKVDKEHVGLLPGSDGRLLENIFGW